MKNSIFHYMKFILRELHFFLQRVFRKHHTSDKQLWNLDKHLAKYIARKLTAFVESKPQGYPSNLEGRGGYDEWINIIKEMIFAFEFFSLDGDEKDSDLRKFYKKYNIEDVHAENEKNKHVLYIVEKNTGSIHIYYTADDIKNIEDDNIVSKEKIVYYNNDALEKELYKRAQKGLELFCKYYNSLWD